MAVILACGRLRQGITASLRPLEMHSKFKASLGYSVNTRKKERREDRGIEGGEEGEEKEGRRVGRKRDAEGIEGGK